MSFFLMARKEKAGSASTAKAGEAITSIKYPAKRKNIPPAGLEAQGVLQRAPRIRYEYNPHLPTVLRSAVDATGADKLPELLTTARQRVLSAEEAKVLEDALRRHEPWLEWSGKREKPWFEVDPVALHMHERVSTQAILRVLAREDVERDLFADPQLDYAKAVQFYQHDMDWASLTHDVAPAALAYVQKSIPATKILLSATLTSGAHSRAVACGRHAFDLADKLTAAVKHLRDTENISGRIHLFIAGPGGFVFYLGQQQSALGPTTLYEFDFEGAQGGSYEPSLTFPVI